MYVTGFEVSFEYVVACDSAVAMSFKSPKLNVGSGFSSSSDDFLAHR